MSEISAYHGRKLESLVIHVGLLRNSAKPATFPPLISPSIDPSFLSSYIYYMLIKHMSGMVTRGNIIPAYLTGLL